MDSGLGRHLGEESQRILFVKDGRHGTDYDMPEGSGGQEVGKWHRTVYV